MKLAIVIPAYNEEKTVGSVIDSLPKAIKGIRKIDVIVVNDGSNDDTLEEIKNYPQVTVLSHLINRGLGAALGTGFKYAIRHNADIIVSFDADGQHDPKDIEKIIKPILNNKSEAVIGSRLMKPKGMPWYRVVGNLGLNLATLVLFGIWTTDSQSGLRAFSRNALQKIDIRSDRMEVSSEIVREISRKKIKFTEVPVSVIYSDYSLAKGQRNINGINIILKMFLKGFGD
ncbi:MAG: Undecaprenyl-phosphate mannosyltransferase [bacterium ADurb.Bin400]|nr:MAG: Undecaprenyl-phosphate mannosyltransferase [bacterium ADurb.Bin400]